MRLFATTALCSLFTASLGGAALAAKTTTKPGLVAKDAFAKKTGGTLDHAHEVYSFSHNKEMVLGWKGANTGPGARGAYMMVVPLANNRATMLANTKISGNLAKAGEKLVRAHLQAQGLTGKIQLGDHMASSPRDGQRLKQHPFTRDSGFIRYTVTERSGAQKRYLVWTNPRALASGKGKMLGKVTLDMDWYGQKPLRPVQ